MIAFWKYDQFPGVLSGRVVGDILKGGYVHVEGYDRMQFKPVALLNDEDGRNVQGVLEAIAIDRNVELADLNTRMNKRLRGVADFMKDIAK